MIVNFIIDLVTVMFCPFPLFLTAKEAVQQAIRLISESKEILPQCNALISSVPVLCVSESKEIFPHCNAPIISVPVLCHF